LKESTLRHLPFLGLLVGIAGLLVQWIADPSKFDGNPFPPGIAFIAGAGLLMFGTARWWWHPVFGVLIAFWIVGVGTLANQLPPQLASPNAGTVTGNVVMACGLIFTFVTGIRAMIKARRAT
jgi:hypothetical protein